MVPPDPTSYIIAAFIRAVLYGLYIATFVQCFRWIIFVDNGLRLRKHIDRRLLIITILILIFISTSLVIVFRIVMDLIRGDNSSAKLTIARIILDCTAILITNAVLIYRCWIIYSKTHRWIIVGLPIVLWLSGLVCSSLIVYFYAMFLLANPEVFLVFSRLVLPSRICWLIFYLCDIFINIYTTCSIIYRITRVSAHASNDGTSGTTQLNRTCKTLAQFGLLYTITTLLSLISLLVDVDPKFDAVRFSLDAVNFLAPGITFNMIQIVVHQERASGPKRETMTGRSGRALSLPFFPSRISFQRQSSKAGDLNEA